MAKRVSVDKWLFTVILLLVFIGLIMVFSASAVMAKARFGSSYGFLLRQLGWAAAGIAAMLVVMNIDYKQYRRSSIVFTFLGFTTLLLVTVFLFHDSHNTHRWIKAGPLSFQPSELAKPAIILYLAYFLESRWQQIADWKHVLIPAAAPSVLLALLIIKEPDLGTAVACMAITASVLYIAGMKMRYLGYGILASLLPLYFLIVRVPWRWHRIIAFLDPLERSAGSRIPHHPVDDCRQHWRTDGRRPDGRQAEALLSPRAAHRLHLRQHRRRTWTLGGDAGCRPVQHISVSWDSYCAAHARSLRALPGDGNHSHGRGAGAHQHERRPRHDADQGNPIAFRLLWRLISFHHPCERRNSAEHHAANGLVMRVIVAGGGTGGHVIPALAIAQELKSQYNAEVLFIGTARGIETRLVPAAGFRLELITVGGLNRVSLATRLKTLFDLPRAIVQSAEIISAFRPDVMVGVGGYASGPAMLAASLMSVPMVAFEPNVVPGFANRMVAPMVGAAAVHFAATQRYFRNAVVTGVPVRREFFEVPARSSEGPPTLLVFGGSQGAHAINVAVIESLAQLAKAVAGIHLIHQTGEKDYDEAQAAVAHSGISAEVAPFIDDMPGAFARADLAAVPLRSEHSS